MKHRNLTELRSLPIIGIMGDWHIDVDEGSHKEVSATPHGDTTLVSAQALQLMEAMPVGVILYDHALSVCQMNETARCWLPPLKRLDQCLGSHTESSTGPSEGWSRWLQSPWSSPTQTAQLNAVAFIGKSQVRWMRLQTKMFPLSAKKPPVLAILVLEDLGQAVRLRQKQDHQERLAALGTITSKVAHELNSPLDGILRYLNLTTRSIEQQRPDKSQEYLDRCREGVRRMVHIVGELLEHARLPRKRSETAPLRSTIDDALHATIVKTTSAPVDVHVTVDADLPNVYVSQLYQVLCNVLRNAYEAMPAGGTLSIQAHRKTEGMLAIDVTDTGTGIRAENLASVFDPFFTTKETGTGLGLAVSRDIVQGCGGDIQLESQTDQGTTVHIHLPMDRISGKPKE